MIIFLRIETITGKGGKKAERYSLRLEVKPESSAALESEIKVKQGTEEIHIDESLTRKLQDFAEFHKHPASIKNIRIGETLTQQLEWEEVLGIEIYQTFFPGFIGKTFEDCLNLLHQDRIDRLTLIIGSTVPWILDIPFEMMRKEKGSQPLSVCHENFHLVHSIETSFHGFQEAVVEASAPPLKILFVSALAVDLPDEDRLIELEKEQELLISAVGELISEQKVVVEFLDIATLEEIEKSLREGQHQVVHFSGHGAHRSEPSQESGVLYLEDEWGRVKAVPGQKLAQSLKKFPSICLVVLSACETARADESGVAGALLKAGIPAALGMRYPVGDDAARLFTTSLYKDISAGKSLEYAIYSARKAVYDADKRRIKNRKKEKEESLIVTEWMTPFLFQVRNIRQLLDHKKKPGTTHHFFHKPQNSLVEGAKYVCRGFIGRHKEILNLLRLFREGHRSVCIYGQGGTGKTTLAVRFAHHFDKGAFLIIRFDNVVSEESILSRLAEAASPSLGEGIKNFVQSPDYDPVTKLNLLIGDFLSKEKIILLFDNFEENQIAATENDGPKTYQREIHSESLKGFLVHLCKNIKKSSFILFTTRYRFLEPEVVYLNLGEMRFSDTFKLINRFRKLVQLTSKEKRKIHQKLGGHPRALELLESCISHENIGWDSVSQKFQKVEDREINQDLLLDMLWERLTVDEQKALMGASVLRSLTAMEGLMAITEQERDIIGQSVGSLNGLSLIYMEDERFYTHRLTAAFVKRTKMDENQVKDYHVKAGKYFEGLEDNEGRHNIIDFLEARWHYLEAEDWNRACELTIVSESFITILGYPQLSFELVTEISGKNINKENQVSVYHSLGNLYFRFGDYVQALKQCKRSMKISKKIGDTGGISASLNQIGLIYQNKGDYDQALIQYERSLDILKKMGNTQGISASLHNIGMIYQNKGDYDQALIQYEKSMKISKKVGDIQGASITMRQVGIIYQHKGDYDQALKQFEKSLETSEKIDDIQGISVDLYYIGMIYENRGDYDQALKQYEKSLGISEKIGYTKGVLDSLYQIGNIYFFKGDYNQALKQFEKTLNIFKKMGDIQGVSDSLYSIGTIYEKRGNYELALEQYEKVKEIREKIGDIRGVSNCLHQIGIIYQDKGDYDQALNHYRKSLEIYEKIGAKSGAASSLSQMGILYFETKHYNTALLFLIKGFLIFSKLGSPNVDKVKGEIQKVKGKIPVGQFDRILKEFDLPPDVFDAEEDEDPKEKAMLFVKSITYEAVYAEERSSEGKEKLVTQLKNFIELSDAPENERIKAYFQMLLAYVTGRDYMPYMKKIPGELVEIFEKTKSGF